MFIGLYCLMILIIIACLSFVYVVWAKPYSRAIKEQLQAAPGGLNYPTPPATVTPQK
jgi:hypothetical protein